MRQGFTLIELLIVLALLAIILAFSAPVALSHYQAYVFISERDEFLSLLRRARTLSLANRNSQPHGLYIDAASYIIFEGSDYLNRNPAYDEIFPRAQGIDISGPTEIVFAPLSAASAGGNITLSYGDQSVNFKINTAGGITW